jgi:hypothetical protein
MTEKQIWWEGPNGTRIPTAILVALILGFRIYSIYRSSKTAPKRSLKVRRMERIVAISLWSLIAIGVTLILLFKR